MRLLNVNTRQLSEFDDQRIPPYIITSHRWCGDEPCFRDVDDNTGRPSEGWKKVEGFCKFVRDENARRAVRNRRNDVCDWVWLDTVCINKDSDAEVTESINSMFRWYRRAQVCFAYLVDVRPLSAGREAVLFDFQHSNWFSRGWTLQELVAPRQVVFFTSEWEVIGMSTGPPHCNGPENLGNLIADITGIPKNVFGNREHLRSLTPTERSKWIQKRETKKIEDIAYCLLGILGVNMPLCYGERGNAWQRLEEAVSRKYAKNVSLPKPNALNKRNSGQEFPYWFQSLQPEVDPELVANSGLRGAENRSETSRTSAVIPNIRSVEENTSLSRRQSPSSPPIPSYHPDRLGETLLMAAAEGDELRLREIIGRGADLCYRDRSGFTALHHASLQGHETVAKVLIAAGADLNAQSLELGTPLCLSALQGHAKMVALLLETGANVNDTGRWTGTPLHCVCWNGSVDTVQLLLRHEADLCVTSTIWSRFLEHGSSLGCDVAVSAGNLASRASEADHEIFECQPMIVAVHRRQSAVVRLLVESGYPIDLEHRYWITQRPDEESFEDKDGNHRCSGLTALMAAAWEGPITLVSKLLQARAAINKRDSWGRSALLIAAQSGQLSIVRVLIDAGAEVNAVSSSGQSALHLALEIGHPGLVEYLLGKGADVDRADRSRRTACHFAAFNGDVKILDMLFSHRARYEYQDEKGLRPLHYALQQDNNIPVIKYLLDHEASPHTPDKQDQTPLHYAAKRGSSAVLLLLDAGANALAEDSIGLKPFDYLPAETQGEVRRRLAPDPLRLPLRIPTGTSFHGRSLSDSSVHPLGDGSRRSSLEAAAVESEPWSTRLNDHRSSI